MANFPPFRNYLFYCLDKIIKQYQVSAPFLDAGCGVGDFSRFLGMRDWDGKAIDLSKESIAEAHKKLASFTSVTVLQQPLEDEYGKYNSIFLLDILEHIADDRQVLKKVSGLLNPDGFLVLAIPSNPEHWGWDDDFYGHVRRYTLPELKQKLEESGFQIVGAWDFTYPFFYFLRWLYLRLQSRNPAKTAENAEKRTEQSGMAPEWQQSFGSRFLTSLSIFWQPLYWIMFTFFKSNVRRGHEMIVLAKR